MDYIADGVWLTGELLNPDECASLLASSQEAGYREARMKDHGRHNGETLVRRPDLAAKLWFRLNSEMDNHGGVAFRARELSASLRCYLYQPGDRVGRISIVAATGRRQLVVSDTGHLPQRRVHWRRHWLSGVGSGSDCSARVRHLWMSRCSMRG